MAAIQWVLYTQPINAVNMYWFVSV
jgi:hypothetical protein